MLPSHLYRDQLLVRNTTIIITLCDLVYQLNCIIIHDCVVIITNIFSAVGSDFDFSSTIFTVRFAAGVENVLVHIQIPIVDDMNAEETETFTARLTSTDQSVQIINDTATVNIFDDDGEA